MDSRNTIDKKSYLIFSIICSIPAFIWYNLFFRSLSWCTYEQSRGVLLLIIVFVTVINFTLTLERERTYLSLLTMIVLPYGIYTWMSYSDKERVLVLISIIATVILVVVNVGLVIANRIIHKKSIEYILRKTLRDVVYLVRNWGSIISVVLMIFISVQVMKDDEVVAPIEPDVPSTEVSTDHKAQDYMDQIVKFGDGTWESLSEEERLILCALIVQIETRSLGMTETPGITVKNLEGTTLACYSNQNKLICIDRAHLMQEDGMLVLSSTCHEVRHYYQHRIVELYDSLDENEKSLAIFDEVRYIKNNYKDYISADEDEAGYWTQYIEGDAREYARLCVKFYEELICYHINSMEEGTAKWEE